MPYTKTKDNRLVNEVTLGDGYPLSNDLQPLKVGGEASPIEMSTSLPDGSDSSQIKVNGDLDITGTLKTKLSHNLIYDFDDEVNTLAQVKIDALVDSAPGALDTLNELAAALNDDASFSTTVTNSLALKAPLAAPAFTGNASFAGVTDFNSRVDINRTAFPQLSFSDDSGTDILNMGQSGEIFYFKTSDTANDIRFRRSDNTDVLNFDMSNARVGIGTTSPSVKLDVEESSVSALIDIHQSASSTGTDSGIRFQKNSNLKGTVGYNAGTDTVNLNYGAFDNTHLNIDSSGKVGIGTASPSEMLHLKGAGDVKILLEADTDNTTETDNPEIMFSQDGGGVTGSIGFTDVNDLRITNAYNHDDGDIHLQTRSTTRMSVLGNGNVGIGTGSASTLLHIHKEMSNNADNSLMTIQGDLASGDLGTEKVLIDFTMTDANANNYPQVKIGAAVGKNSDANSLSKEGSGAFVVYTSAGTSDVDGEDNTAERMRVDYQGNVGIGTTSPQSALHVEEGDIRIDTAQNGTQALRFSDRNGTEGQLQYNSQYLKLRMLTDAADGTDTKRLTVLGGQDATAVGIGTDDPTTTLDVEGTVSYKSIGLSSSSDAFDVSGATTVTANSASGNIILGGFSNGVLGQIIHVIHRSPTNSLRFEHNEATATQPIYTSTSADKTLSGYGGMTLFCDGSNWFEIGN